MKLLKYSESDPLTFAECIQLLRPGKKTLSPNPTQVVSGQAGGRAGWQAQANRTGTVAPWSVIGYLLSIYIFFQKEMQFNADVKH